MAKPYKLLRNRMSPQARARAEAKTQEMLNRISFKEQLRQARILSRKDISKRLDMNRADVSEMEQRTDMYINTLRGFISAMGGSLEIIARFPDGNVKVNQFEEFDEK